MMLYRFAVTVAAPFILARLWLRERRGRAPSGALRERLCLGAQSSVTRGPVLWFHGASLGELAAIRAMVATAVKRDANLRIVLTCNTETGRLNAQGWGLDRVVVRFAPLDQRACVKRFLSAWQPAALVTVENEIWPNRFQLCAGHNIPIFLIGARMSDKSARTWQRLGARFRKRVFGAIDYLAAQDAGSQKNFEQLGVAPSAIGPRLMLKGDVTLPDVSADVLARFLADFDPNMTVLGASTHEGEERAVLRAFKLARAAIPTLRLILAPRHSDRGDEVAGIIQAEGLTMARRSKGEVPAKADVFLADTLGEMALWYRLAGIVFVGGSLANKGGHTPFEPVHFGSAVIHGPHTANNQAAYRALTDNDGAIAVTSSVDLSRAFRALVRDPARRQELVRNARVALAPLRQSDDGKDAFWRRLSGAAALPALSG